MAAVTELSYAQSSLSLNLRADGRGCLDYRPISVSIGAAPQANGSAQVTTGKGATVVLAGVKLEVCQAAEISSDGQVVFSVDCTPAALEALASDPSSNLADWLGSVFGPALAGHPQLVILPPPQTKLWRVYVDVVILSASAQSGPLYDAVTLAVKSALWDLKIPKTRGVAYQQQQQQQQQQSSKYGGGETEHQDESRDMLGMKGLLRSGPQSKARSGKNINVDFELESYWDEGNPLSNRDELPVAITLNLSGKEVFVDATNAESLAAPSRFMCAFNGKKHVVALRQESDVELEFSKLTPLISQASGMAQELLETFQQTRHPSGASSS